MVQMRGCRVVLGGSYSGDTGKLFKSLQQEDILQFSLVGREMTLQTVGERLDDVMKALHKAGVSNVNILEWKRQGVTLAGSGSGSDAGKTVKVSLMPSPAGAGLKPLSAAPKVALERRLYVEMLVNIEAVLSDAGVSDALYVVRAEKEASKEAYLEASREAALNALFDAGGAACVA
jgi:hypothetical protein